MSANRILIAIVATLQLAVLLGMAGEREWIARRGEPLRLRTVPVDPRDPMRGDYVRLQYEISLVPRELCRGEVAKWFKPPERTSRGQRDRVVYAALRRDESGVGQLEALSTEPPTSGPFLRGRVDRVDATVVHVRYGVEALFMQQGAAQAFEDEVRTTKAGVAVNVRVAVGRGGRAVLVDYEWEPLGLTLTPEFQDRPGAQGRTPRGPERRLTGLTVEVKNHGEAAQAVVIGPKGEGLRLVRDSRRRAAYAWVSEGAAPPAAASAHVVVLAPGQTHRVRLDLDAPPWFVVELEEPEAPPRALGDVSTPWQAWFRVEYQPPAPVEREALPQAELIWPGVLRSRLFSPGGALD